MTALLTLSAILVPTTLSISVIGAMVTAIMAVVLLLLLILLLLLLLWIVIGSSTLSIIFIFRVPSLPSIVVVVVRGPLIVIPSFIAATTVMVAVVVAVAALMVRARLRGLVDHLVRVGEVILLLHLKEPHSLQLREFLLQLLLVFLMDVLVDKLSALEELGANLAGVALVFLHLLGFPFYILLDHFF